MNDDNDINLMSWMTDAELDRYTKVLEEVQAATAALERLETKLPNIIGGCDGLSRNGTNYQGKHPEYWREQRSLMMGDKSLGELSKEERQRILDITGQWESALQTHHRMQRQVLDRVGGELRGWEKLLPLVLEAIESLANKGVTPSQAGGRKDFFRLVYSELVSRHAKELALSPDFRHVRVMAFLLEPFSNRCRALALEYRQRGELYLAGLLDLLAEQ